MKLQLESSNSVLVKDPGRLAPLLHKWFARRRPEAVNLILDKLEILLGKQRLQIYDPFMGSGMLLLEAALRGHSVYGVDINPVAWLIARQSLNPIPYDRLLKALRDVQFQVAEKISSIYKTINQEGEEADTVTAFYVRLISDNNGHDLELHHNYLLARKRSANWAIYYCPICHSVFKSSCDYRVTCSLCGNEFIWSDGNVSRGHAHCRICEESYELKRLYQDERNSPRFKMIAVESFSEAYGRRFHTPSELDQENTSIAAKSCSRNPFAVSIRSAQIPSDRRDPRPISHGFKYYGDLFTPRQLLCLGLIAEAISEVKDIEERFALSLALSDAAGNNNLMCRYAADWLKLTPAFGLHGFDVVTRPVEGNVWGAGRGRGSFRNCVMKAAKAYSAIDRVFRSISITDHTKEVICSSAQVNSGFDDKKVDAILTDPPYFDNLDYAELADFYYQWLRLVLKEVPQFNPSHCFNENDLSILATNGDGGSKFWRELAACFKTSLRRLSKGGIIAFTYHHSRLPAWLALRNALNACKLATFELGFVRSELDNGFHSADGNIKVDAIFYCKQRDLVNSHDIESMIKGAVRELENLQDLKIIDLISAKLAIATALSSLETGKPFDDLVQIATTYVDR